MNTNLEQIEFAHKDEIVMKLLHYFITECGYNPIVLHGAQNEIWLENLSADYRIIRIVSNYIHNDEQFDFDLYRTKQIMKRIKHKTFSLNMNAMTFFLNLGENVHFENYDNHLHPNLLCFNISDMNDFQKYDQIMEEFPNIMDVTDFKEKGFELFMKINNEINEKNEIEAKKAEKVFEKKTPYVTYGLIILNVLIFIAMYIFGYGSTDTRTLLFFGANYAPLVLQGEYYRLLTSAFLHIGIVHLVMNMYALYVIGPQLENFYGKVKFCVIYLGSALSASLMSLLFTQDAISAGASGAIFGLLGALLYFGYHYRVYLGNVMKSQIIPLILLNLFMGFVLAGVDNAAHVGGLIGGILIASMVGVRYRSTKSDKINGLIMTVIYFAFLIYMGFFH